MLQRLPTPRPPGHSIIGPFFWDENFEKHRLTPLPSPRPIHPWQQRDISVLLSARHSSPLLRIADCIPGMTHRMRQGTYSLDRILNPQDQAELELVDDASDTSHSPSMFRTYKFPSMHTPIHARIFSFCGEPVTSEAAVQPSEPAPPMSVCM